MSFACINVGSLPKLSREKLIALWVELYRRDPPKAVSRRLLERSVAYAIQAKTFGGLSPKTKRRLERMSSSTSVARAHGQPALVPGTRLMRTWKGVTYIVDVTDDGFIWNGERYRSLSAIASAITSARWSGPRFFGLSL